MPELKNKVLELKKISWETIKKDFEFNNLKNNTNRNVAKLKKSIKERGFFSPFYVWNKYILDGTGRSLAIKELEKEGFEIPDLPCLFVEANNIAEAKIYALQMSSQHGEITPEGLYEFVVDIPEVETLIDEVDFYEFNEEFGSEIEKELTEKLETLEKKNKKPLKKGHILLSINIEKFNELAEKIQKIVDTNNNIEYEVAAN